MKKVQKIFLIILSITIITSCGASEDKIAIYDGDYSIKVTDEEAFMAPTISINDDKFTFSFDLASSYLPVGSYEISGDSLILKTDDNNYKYIFRIEDKSLFFIKSESSDVSLIDSRLGIQIENDSEFVLSN